MSPLIVQTTREHEPVHGHTANLGAVTEPAVATGFAEVAAPPERVADPPDSRDAVLQDLADFSALETDLRVLAVVLVLHDGAVPARGADEQRATLRVECDAVHGCAWRDETKGNDVAGLEEDGAEQAERERRRRGRHRFSLPLGVVRVNELPTTDGLLGVDEAGTSPSGMPERKLWTTSPARMLSGARM